MSCVVCSLPWNQSLAGRFLCSADSDRSPLFLVFIDGGGRGGGGERIAWVKEESCSSSQVLEMFDLRLESIGRLNEDSDGGQKIIFTELFIVKISGEIWFRTWIYITGFSFFFFYVQANVNHELNMRQRTQHSYVVFGILITLANQ